MRQLSVSMYLRGGTQPSSANGACGATAPGGACRLLPCRDAMLAVNLPQPGDWKQMPAWLYSAGGTGAELATGNWERLAQLLAQARVLSLAVARADQIPAPPAGLTTPVTTGTTRSAASTGRAPLVVDLSALWAGPLCSHLLYLAGFRVIKVEARHRPDGARSGNTHFYNLLNQGKQCLSLDFKSPRGVMALQRLLQQADIVIEASRPRALRDLGIDAEQLVRASTGLTWISITAHGHQGEDTQRVGFGDDAAAAAGLSALLHEQSGEWHMVGDAIADPLTGIHAALAARESFQRGGGELLALSLRGVTGYLLHQALNQDRAALMAGSPSLPLACHPKLFTGPTKVHLHDTQLPELEWLVALMQRSHEQNRAVAVHCVTEVELVFTLSAFAEAGTLPGDRIEHASLTPESLLEQIAELGLWVVTQPHFIHQRGDAYLADIPLQEHPHLYRCRSFIERDIPLAAGTDAPFGQASPWHAMASAQQRRTASGALLGPGEALTHPQSLALFTGSLSRPHIPQALAPGAVADLCLLSTPWAQLTSDMAAPQVALTLARGEVIYQHDPDHRPAGGAPAG